MDELNQRLAKLMNEELAKPIYFKVSHGEDGRLAVEQVVFLRSHDLASLIHIKERTIRGWATKNLIPCVKTPGSSILLFDLNDVIRALRNVPLETGHEGRGGLSIARP